MKLLKKGDRVRAKVATMFGWKGTGTVAMDMTEGDDTVTVWKDGFEHESCHGYPMAGSALFCRHEVAKMRNQQ